MIKSFTIPIEQDPILSRLKGQRAMVQFCTEKIEGREYQDDIDYFNFKIESYITRKRNKKIKLIMND